MLYDGPQKELFKKDEKIFKACKSTDEFKKSYEFLIKESDLSLNDTNSLVHALEISKGCNGAAGRFIELYSLLKKSGVDLGQSFKYAKIFAGLETERAESFREIFKKAFLENNLDLDFLNAFELALALSKDYKGDPAKIKNDFVSLVKFCTGEKDMSLSYKYCGQMIIKLSKSTEMYPQGVFPEFKKLYDFLRDHKRLGLSIQSTLEIIPEVLKNGPRSVDNFLSAINYSLEGKDLQLNENQALKLAMTLSNQSWTEEKVITEIKK